MTTWHADSALLVCSFDYRGGAPSTPATVSQRIDAALGITDTPPRALLGDVDMMWLDESRLKSIELRTGRGEWERSSLGAPNARVEEMSMTLGLDYDDNRLASVNVEVHVLWDPRLARIGLHFEDVERGIGRWVAIADNAFVNLDDEGLLRELRFANVQFVSGDPS